MGGWGYGCAGLWVGGTVAVSGRGCGWVWLWVGVGVGGGGLLSHTCKRNAVMAQSGQSIRVNSVKQTLPHHHVISATALHRALSFSVFFVLYFYL